MVLCYSHLPPSPFSTKCPYFSPSTCPLKCHVHATVRDTWLHLTYWNLACSHHFGSRPHLTEPFVSLVSDHLTDVSTARGRPCGAVARLSPPGRRGHLAPSQGSTWFLLKAPPGSFSRSTTWFPSQGLNLVPQALTFSHCSSDHVEAEVQTTNLLNSNKVPFVGVSSISSCPIRRLRGPRVCAVLIACQAELNNQRLWEEGAGPIAPPPPGALMGLNYHRIGTHRRGHFNP